MAVTPLCTITEIEAKLSQFGLESCLDDDKDGAADPTLADSVIEKASADVGQFLLVRYAPAAIAASAWVKWVTATFAARDASRRRGNPCPESLLEECKDYLEQLKAIRDGLEPLIGDTGPVPPRFNDLPTVSNLIVDGRFRRSKIRRVEATSTGPAPQGGLKQNNTLDWGLNQ
jgi:hypothetical protein